MDRGAGEEYVLMFRKHELETVFELSASDTRGALEESSRRYAAGGGSSVGPMSVATLLPDFDVEYVSEERTDGGMERLIANSRKLKKRARSLSPTWSMFPAAAREYEESSRSKSVIDALHGMEKEGLIGQPISGNSSGKYSEDEGLTDCTGVEQMQGQLSRMYVRDIESENLPSECRSTSMPAKLRAYNTILNSRTLSSTKHGVVSSKTPPIARAVSLPNFQEFRVANKMVRVFKEQVLNFLMENKGFQNDFDSVYLLMNKGCRSVCKRRRSRSKYFT